MLPDDMGIGEGDKTVQLVLIYGSIAILYLVVAYIMFFRSFFFVLFCLFNSCAGRDPVRQKKMLQKRKERQRRRKNQRKTRK